MSHTLTISNLHARIDPDHNGIEAKEILKGVNLTINSGEVHAIMGPNGSGKSTLALVLMGHPGYEVTEGDILLDGQSLLDMPTDERSRAGLFLSFQDPAEVPGVSFFQFMRLATSKHRILRHPEPASGSIGAGADILKRVQHDEKVKSTSIPVGEFKAEMEARMADLHMGEDFLKRHLNTGFSGGEKKRAEMLQMSILKPKMAILDEVDSGLDIDALKLVAATVKSMATEERGILMITHYQRILRYVEPHFVHIFRDGRIVKTGGYELAERLEVEGYDKLTDEAKAEALEEVIESI
jgi:Fe-S cluster assembly ATP-binding protein